MMQIRESCSQNDENRKKAREMAWADSPCSD